MNTLKLILIGAFVFLLQQTYAQEKTISAEKRAEIEAKYKAYLEELNLDEAQKERYKEITKKYADTFKFVREGGLSKEEKINEIKRLQTEKDKEIKAVLSEEQYVIYQNHQASKKGKMLAEFAQQIERLNLTEEQKDEYIAISRKYGEEMRNLKDSGKSKFAKYRAFKAIQKNKNKEMKNLLSNDQYDEYLKIQEEMKKKLKERRGK